MARSLQGESSWFVENFDLPKHDVQETMRNFPGCAKEEYYDLDDMRNGDWFGSTDTDYETHEMKYEEKTKDHSRSPGTEGMYSKVNWTMGKDRKKWFSKQSSKRVTNPNEKSTGFGKLKF